MMVLEGEAVLYERGTPVPPEIRLRPNRRFQISDFLAGRVEFNSARTRSGSNLDLVIVTGRRHVLRCLLHSGLTVYG